MPQLQSKIRLPVCFILLILILVVPSWLSVLALDLGISPPDINLNLNKGEEYLGELYIFGSDTDTVDVKAYAMDWFLTISGNYQFIPLGTINRSASAWVSFTPANFRLFPKRGQKILYTVKVPNDVTGSYWGNIMFDTKPTIPKGKERFQIAVSGRLAFILRIDINGSSPGIGSIEKLKLNWNPATRKLEALFRVKNSGKSFIRFKGRLEIKDIHGKKVTEIPFREGYVLPDYVREFGLQDKDINLTPGYYIGLAIADFGERSLKAVQASFAIK